MSHDYRALGLKAGLEIHQQLNTEEKLFCGCPTLLRDTGESDFEFFRYLRPTQSEMGVVDKAALEEVKLIKKFIYKAYDTTCLVENDEEPPRELNQEAVEYTLTIARMLNMKIVDELYTMRKIVIDGSNTSGFQRTGLVATQGYLETSNGNVGVDVLCLEEEAAQKVEDRGDSVVYSLDRLGIPLVEIGTAPDIVSPEHAKETAAQIGMILRSTGKVKRGLGTIRQDINISIAEGARVEIKGVQDLDLIETIVEREVARQVSLLEIKKELLEKKVEIPEKITDVTSLFENSSSKVISKAVKGGGVVMAINLPGFAGYVGKELQPGRRLGTEFSDRAKKSGVGGIFHTDELPAYGITEDEVRALREAVGANDMDCVVMVADKKKKVTGALEAVITRAKETLEFVPEETRRALPDGNSAYMRPLPGAARMYPETDVPPVLITEERINNIELPELIEEKVERYIKDFKLNRELAGQIARSGNSIIFDNIMLAVPLANPSMVVRTLETIIPELEKEGVPAVNIKEDQHIQLFKLQSEGKVPNEAIGGLLKILATKPEIAVEEAAKSIGIGEGQGELESAIDKLIESKMDFIQEKGLNSVGPLMGVIMKDFRGKVSGQEVSRLLKEKISGKIQDQ